MSYARPGGSSSSSSSSKSIVTKDDRASAAPPAAAASANATATSSSHLLLSAQSLSTFQPSKIFAEDHIDPGTSITSLSFDDRGDFLISAGDDDTIHLWDCKSGKHKLKSYSKKYGVDIARFTHQSNSILYASTKVDNTIRHLLLKDNTYLQYFRGHESKVTSLELSPKDGTFLSAATNESVRLWDLRTPTCQGLFPLQGHPIVAYDPEGLIFAIALNERGCILLYDLRNFTNQPFSLIPIEDSAFLGQMSYPPRMPIITSLTFSPNGIHILAGTAGDLHYVFDSHDGFLLHRLLNHEGLEKVSASSAEGSQLSMVSEAGVSGQECGWTPDGRFVYSGSSDNKVRFWHIPDYTLVDTSPKGAAAAGPKTSNLFSSCELPGHPASPTRVVRFNPRHAMFATASSQVALWLPDLDEVL